MMKKRKMNKIKAILDSILLIISIISFFLLSYALILYKNFATLYRILAILIILYLFILLFYLLRKNIKTNKMFIPFIIIILLNILNISGFYYLNKIYKTFNEYSNTTNLYSSSLVTYDLKLKDYKDLNNAKIGIIKDKKDIEGNQLPSIIIEDLKLEDNNDIVYYESTIELLNALKSENITAAFFSSNYIDMFSSLEDYENIEKETKVLYTESKEFNDNQEDIKTQNSTLTNPFNMLLIGVDSSKDGVTSGYNADVLLLVSFNPKTLNATLTSVPRDMYLKTACSNGKFRRINTTTWGSSSSCAVSTIENLFDVDIDYYAKVNFKGIVDLVNAVGGIDIDVEYSFCEQNSSRKWGNNTVYVKEGYQHLNGEQALALARNRHKPNDGSSAGRQMAKYCPTYNSGTRNDFVRGKNQMKVIMGILNAVTKLKDPNQAIEIMEKINKNFQTNVETQDILELYNLGKSIVISEGTNLINIQRMQLSGKNAYGMIYETSSKSYPAVTLPYQESINAIKEEINTVLGKNNINAIKSISFDLNKQYENNIIGSGNFNITNVTTLKNLSNLSINQIKDYAEENKLKLNLINYDTNETINTTNYDDYYFIKQKEHVDTIIQELDSITIYVKKRSIITSTPSV